MRASAVLLSGIGVVASMLLSTTVAAQSSAAPISRSPIGALDSVRLAANQVTLAGWSFDRDRLGSAEEVMVYQSSPVSRFVARTLTTGLRPDVNRVYKVTGNHGWTASFTGAAGTDVFCAYGINVGSGHNVLLGCRQLVVPAASSAPVGAFDSAAPDGLNLDLAGWALDRDGINAAEAVQIYDSAVPNALLATTTANLVRPDVNAALRVVGNHGWQVDVAETAGEHTVCARAVNLGPARPDVLLGCRSAMLLAPGTGAISGRMSAQTGAPLGGVRVIATSLSDGTKTTAYSRTGDGHYAIAGLVPGRYTVCFGGPEVTSEAPAGYATQCYDQVPVTLAVPVTVLAGTTTLYIDGQPLPAGVINGTVTDQSGRPLEGATVNFSYGVSTVTDANGAYQLRVVPGTGGVCVDGSTLISPSSPSGYLPQCWSDGAGGMPPTLQVGQVLNGVDISLQPAGEITGSVTDDGGSPLAGVTVTLQYGQQSMTTGADGVYRFAGLTPGRFAVSFKPAENTTGGSSTTGYLGQCYQDVPISNCYGWPGSGNGQSWVTVAGGQVTDSINARLHPAGAISGTVTDTSGHPLAGIRVDTDGADARTGADGSYRIDMLAPADDYRVCFSYQPSVTTSRDGYVSQCYDDKTVGFANQVKVVAGVMTTGIDAAMVHTGKIGGRVTDSSGQPVPNAEVNARSETSNRSGQTDADGNYLITGADPGNFQVCVTAVGQPQDYCYGGVIPGSSVYAVPVTDGQTTTGVDIALPPVASVRSTAKMVSSAAE